MQTLETLVRMRNFTSAFLNLQYFAIQFSQSAE